MVRVACCGVIPADPRLSFPDDVLASARLINHLDQRAEILDAGMPAEQKQ